MAKWTREHTRLRESILDALVREARPFDDDSPEAVADRQRLPLLAWGRTYLPHYIKSECTRVHEGIVGAPGEPDMPTFVGAFRGCGKSTWLSLIRPLRQVLNGELPYVIYGAQVLKLAAQLMDFVRIELEKNPRVRADYGELRVEGGEGEWTIDLPRKRGEQGRYLFSSIKFEAFGIGMSPRGRRHREHRPYAFIGDDLETPELARNPRREQNLWDWLWGDAKPAMEPEKSEMTLVGTMFGPGCMLERAAEMAERRDPAGRPLCKLVLQAALDADGHSAWPERFSDAALARIRAQIGLTAWNHEYAMKAHDPAKPFQPEWFRSYKPGDIEERDLDVVAFLDPAISERDTSCPRALVVVGADRKTGERFVLDARIKRFTPSQMLDALYEVHDAWRPRLFGIEINGGYALIKPLLEADRRGWLPVRYVTQTESKAGRIERLSPGMEAGRWAFPAEPNAGVRALQDQFLGYPDGFVDGPDAAAGADALLPDAFRPNSGGVHYESLQSRRNLVGV